jgi:hypothetical protein
MPDTTSQPRPKNSVARVTSAPGTDHGQRLSPVDGSFLRLESPQSHMPTRTLPDAHDLPALIEAELQQLGRAATGPRAGHARVSSA